MPVSDEVAVCHTYFHLSVPSYRCLRFKFSPTHIIIRACRPATRPRPTLPYRCTLLDARLLVSGVGWTHAAVDEHVGLAQIGEARRLDLTPCAP
jgi:hypothetical protein